jgi:hypothetical protein
VEGKSPRAPLILEKFMGGFEFDDPEQRARTLRRRLGVDELSWLDPMTILVKAKRLVPGLNFALVGSSDLPPNVLAQWDSKSKLIRIREGSFCEANGFSCNPRDRYAIFHETIHALEGHAGTFNRAVSLNEIPNYARKLKALERWTETVTAAFMAPKHLFRAGESPETIAFRFGISLQAATIRMDELLPRLHKPRQIPESVAQLLASLKKKDK